MRFEIAGDLIRCRVPSKPRGVRGGEDFVLINDIEPNILGFPAEILIMPDESSDSESAEKKKRDIEVRDVKLKNDPKAGGKDEKKDEMRPSRRKGEADFMREPK